MECGFMMAKRPSQFLLHPKCCAWLYLYRWARATITYNMH